MRIFLMLLLCVTALAACDSPRSQLDDRDLEAAARRLASLDAEAMLFDREVEQGHVTHAFALAHRQALVQESLKFDKELAKPAPEALRTRLDVLALRNARLRDRMLRVEASR